MPRFVRSLVLGWLCLAGFASLAAAQSPADALDPLSGPPSLRLLPPTAEAVDASPPIAEAAALSDEGSADGEATVIDDDLTVVEEEPPTYVWYQPAYWFGPVPWDTGIELGINGSSGTSDSFSVRTGGYINRESDHHKLALSLYYNNTVAEGVTTQSNALFDGRRDWLFTDSAWSLFALTQVFFDEFQAFDLNVNLNGGLGYKVIDNDTTKLGTSIGAGASREFGGPADEWVPEAQFGASFERKLWGGHKFYAKADYFPEFEDFGSYRVLSDAGLELELSRPSNVSLKLAVTDRFDSDPDGVPPHNTNFSVLLLWKL